MKKQKPIKDWQDKLIDLVEEESYLMTGNKSKKHFSSDCKMNDILDLVRREITNYGFNVKIKYKDGTKETRNNITEIHYNYLSPLKIKSVAFESDIHGTGGAIQTDKIEEFEAVLAKRKEREY